MLRVAESPDDNLVAERFGVSPELCAQKRGSQRFIVCLDDEAPPICRMDVREHAEFYDVDGEQVFCGPGVEVSALLPYEYDIEAMLQLMVFTFRALVEQWPELADWKPFAVFPNDVGQAGAWRYKLRDFGVVEDAELPNGRLVKWANDGTVSTLLGAHAG